MTGLSKDDIWRNCNICKVGIPFEAEYFVCSVSTCNRKRTGLTLCSLACFEAHLPTARHRDAWAERQKAPTRAEWQASLDHDADIEETRPSAEAPRPPVATRKVVTGSAPNPEPEADVLVVVSKLKKYVRDWSGMNTSDAAVSVLSDHLRAICREATRQAGLDGRRTVLDRDFAAVLKQRREGGPAGTI